MKPIFLLLGGNKLNLGIVKKFQQMDYLVYVVDWNEYPQLIGDKHYRIDVKDAESIIEALEKDNVFENVKFAYTSIDLAVGSVANLNRKFGLRVLSSEGLKNVSSKSMMTKCWAEAGLLNRISKSYKLYDDEIWNFAQSMQIIIKPDNSSSSRGITIIHIGADVKTIQSAFYKALHESSNGKVIVEEYVDGTEFTVEMLGDSYGNVCVYGVSLKVHTKHADDNKIAVKLHYNSVPLNLQKKIAEFGIKCYKALGITASLGHLELVLKKDGIMSPIEIGARSSGYIASDLVDIVSGRNYLLDLLEVQKGIRVCNGLCEQTDKSSMYFFYDFPSNLPILNECSLMDFCSNPIISRYWDRSNIRKGKIFSNIDNDNARFGYEILEGSRDVLELGYIDSVERAMLTYMFVEK